MAIDVKIMNGRKDIKYNGVHIMKRLDIP